MLALSTEWSIPVVLFDLKRPCYDLWYASQIHGPNNLAYHCSIWPFGPPSLFIVTSHSVKESRVARLASSPPSASGKLERREASELPGPISPGHQRSSSYRSIKESLIRDGLFDSESSNKWRVGCQPFPLPKKYIPMLEELGQHLLQFYQSLNTLYYESVKGRAPGWVHEYLDLGKPKDLLQFAHMKRFRDHIPGVIRPDLILTETGLALTELDAVPGGIGLTGSLSQAYHEEGFEIWPHPQGLVHGFSDMLAHVGQGELASLAIVVSDEAEEYRAEMQWLADRLNQEGWKAWCVHPREIRFTEEGLRIQDSQGLVHPISLLYRFFELFDLKNIPKSELMMYSAKKGKIQISPPFKPWLEEKLALALFHHPRVQGYWEKVLPIDTQEVLRGIIPETWILDPRPVPPSAIIPGLQHEGQAVSDWTWLGEATQKEREFVVKVSGFSPQAWGSRGVSIGHDMAQGKWKEVLNQALGHFEDSPSILQKFHKGRVVVVEYHDSVTGVGRTMEGRVRLSPYYFVRKGRAELGGVLATICPKDKKIIHGMQDAVMVPCTVE